MEESNEHDHSVSAGRQEMRKRRKPSQPMVDKCLQTDVIDKKKYLSQLSSPKAVFSHSNILESKAKYSTKEYDNMRLSSQLQQTWQKRKYGQELIDKFQQTEEPKAGGRKGMEGQTLSTKSKLGESSGGGKMKCGEPVGEGLVDSGGTLAFIPESEIEHPCIDHEIPLIRSRSFCLINRSQQTSCTGDWGLMAYYGICREMVDKQTGMSDIELLGFPTASSKRDSSCQSVEDTEETKMKSRISRGSTSASRNPPSQTSARTTKTSTARGSVPANKIFCPPGSAKVSTKGSTEASGRTFSSQASARASKASSARGGATASKSFSPPGSIEAISRASTKAGKLSSARGSATASKTFSPQDSKASGVEGPEESGSISPVIKIENISVEEIVGEEGQPPSAELESSDKESSLELESPPAAEREFPPEEGFLEDIESPVEVETFPMEEQEEQEPCDEVRSSFMEDTQLDEVEAAPAEVEAAPEEEAPLEESEPPSDEVEAAPVEEEEEAPLEESEPPSDEVEAAPVEEEAPLEESEPPSDEVEAAPVEEEEEAPLEESEPPSDEVEAAPVEEAPLDESEPPSDEVEAAPMEEAPLEEVEPPSEEVEAAPMEEAPVEEPIENDPEEEPESESPPAETETDPIEEKPQDELEQPQDEVQNTLMEDVPSDLPPSPPVEQEDSTEKEVPPKEPEAPEAAE